MTLNSGENVHRQIMTYVNYFSLHYYLLFHSLAVRLGTSYIVNAFITHEWSIACYIQKSDTEALLQ